MKVGRLVALAPDTLGAMIRRREHGMVPAPRPPFAIGVGDDFAVVTGADVQRGYAWQDGVVRAVDRASALSGAEPAREVATLARSGRAAVDARALVDAILGDVAIGPWLVRDDRGNTVYRRVESGALIGRSTEAHMRISLGTVARHHARLEAVGGRWFVDDLASTNGTFVRGQRVTRAEIADGDVISVAGNDVTFRTTLVPVPRSIDPADDASWSRLYLDRVELGYLEHDPPRYAAVAPTRPACVRGGVVTWSGYRDLTGTDTRWLFAERDDADVFTDVLLASERDELPAPIVGDLCACFRAGDGVVAIARVGRVVARFALSDATRDLDYLAHRMVLRAVR